MNGQPNILICDDDPVVHESLAIYLDNDNFTHEDAYDGREALDMAQTGSADLILLDVMMPEMSGLDVCREVRKSLSTPIIILTAKGEEIDKILGLELGADDYIVKPFSPREVIARIKAVLRRFGDTQQSSSVLKFPGLEINLGTIPLRSKANPFPAHRRKLRSFIFLLHIRVRSMKENRSLNPYGDSTTAVITVQLTPISSASDRRSHSKVLPGASRRSTA